MIIKSVVLCIFTFMLSVFANANQKCADGEHWVAAHLRRAYTRYDGTHVRAANVKGHCRKNPRGYEKWNQRLSNNRPKVWGYTQEKSKKWTVEEIQRLLDAISVLPDELVNLGNVKIYRMKSSKFPGNPATSDGSEVTLYDKAFEHKDSLAQILSHELSHIVYRKIGKNDKDKFHQEANWIKQRDKSGNTYYTPKSEKVFIQPDSRDSMSEDFANHIEHFLFKNNSLKKESKAAYRWIKIKFGKNFRIQREVK